jgi:type IV secretory pathway VirB10-like protein
MSYILDALKKLEQEKARKSRSMGKINITGELFGNARVRPPEGRRLKTVLLVSAAVLFTFGATWFLLKGNGMRGRVTPLSSVTRPTPAANIPVPAPAVPVPAPVVTQVPAAPPQAAVVPLPAPPVAQPAAASSATPDDEEEEGSRHRRRRSASAKATITAPPQPHESVGLKPGTPPADIKVSGIAWQDERSARRAVVNGFLMREGAVVSGAKITEILQDRVRFSLSGTSFEVSFISTGSPNAGK